MRMDSMYYTHHHQLRYSPDRALASLMGFMIVIVQCGLSAQRSTWFYTPWFSHQRHLVVTTRKYVLCCVVKISVNSFMSIYSSYSEHWEQTQLAVPAKTPTYIYIVPAKQPESKDKLEHNADAHTHEPWNHHTSIAFGYARHQQHW
jgi:hypothetical protein